MHSESDAESHGDSDRLQMRGFSEAPPVLRKRLNDGDLCNSKRLKINDQKVSRIDIRMEVNPTDSNNLPHATKKISQRTTEKKFGKDVTNVLATNSNHKTNKNRKCSGSNFSEEDKAILDKLTSNVLKGFPELTSAHKDQLGGEQNKGYFNRHSRMVVDEIKWTEPKEVVVSNYQKENEDAKIKIRKRTETVDKVCNNQKEQEEARKLSSQGDATKKLSSMEELNIDSNTEDITLFESLSENEESSSSPETDNVKLFDLDSTEIIDTKKVEETVPVRSLRPRGSTRNMFKAEQSDDFLSPKKSEEKSPHRNSYKQSKKVLKKGINVDDADDKAKHEMERLQEIEDIFNNYELIIE